MAKSSRRQSPRGGGREKDKTGGQGKRPSRPAAPLRERTKLDKISDAPESGEPDEQGRSRGRTLA